jgi:hypothetical protein
MGHCTKLFLLFLGKRAQDWVGSKVLSETGVLT